LTIPRFRASHLAAVLAAGLPGVHFYAMNKSPATYRVLHAVRAILS
jgi:hypothetical protein